VRVRVWFDGESFYSERMNVFNSMKEPCWASRGFIATAF
jgi:hypothetical protein